MNQEFEINISDREADTMKRRVMRRVWIIYLVRKIKSPFATKVGMLLALFLFEAYLVSIPNVVINFTGSMGSITDFGNALGFAISAFRNTQLTVQILSTGVIIAGLFFARDVLKWSGLSVSSFRGLKLFQGSRV